MAVFRENFGIVLLLAVLTMPFGAIAQQSAPDAPTPQNIPDAPSASKPTLPMPNPTAPTRPAQTSDGTPAPGSTSAGSSPQPQSGQAPQPESQQPPAPQPQVRTVPQGQETKERGSDREQLYSVVKEVNFVLVPVTVKDANNRPVYGLVRNDFSLLEDGSRRSISFFTSDPFPISAAIVIDVGMADVALRKIQETVPALAGSFSEFDEVSIYTYGNTVKQRQDFAAATSERTTRSLDKLKEVEGRTGGVPVVGGPMTSGPTINGRPADPGNLSTRPNTTSVRNIEPSRVLNDAILRAALDLSKRDRTRRKIIFVISEGREFNSTASYADVLKVLLTNEVTVYGVAVDSAAIPGYKQLSKIHLPRQGYGNILPKYANATGGDIFEDYTREGMEEAYGRITEEARNQYTLGYNTAAVPSPTYRTIEVRVNRPGLKIQARDGYYPLPPQRSK